MKIADLHRKVFILVSLVLIGLATVTASTNLISVDGDSLPVVRELEKGTDPLAADTDQDGLDDDREIEEGTDPVRVDSDDDSMMDGTELERGTNPLEPDTDSDGLEDGMEMMENTDPLEPDTDSDGLQDGDEVSIGTDPNKTDTDEDLLNDSFEHEQLQTDPTEADTDGEGLNDSQELDHGTDPVDNDTDSDSLNDYEEAFNYSSDPLEADTDSDGLEDGEEISRGLEPDDSDTDSDGLNDSEELSYGTDPLEADTDSDGLNDGTEIQEGTDPLQEDTDSDKLDDYEEVVEYDTSPTQADTDSDGLEDGEEIKIEALEDADPLKRDVFVEVDYMSNHRPSESALERVEESFSESPIRSPSGTGVDLHIFIDEEIERMEEVDSSTQDELMEEYSQRDQKGYHHAIAVHNATLDDENVGGFAESGEFVFQAEYPAEEDYPDGWVSSVFAHELGHSMGLGAGEYTGIDSEDISFSDYSSVMNYNAPDDYVDYSNGAPFNDWMFFQDQMYTPPVSSP